jgi:nucleoside-diphosphate-sugar epimerase
MFRLGYFPLIEGGRALMDVTYVGNVVKAISQIIDANEQVVGKAYNITNGQPITFSQLIQKVAGVLELKVKPISLPYRVMWCLAGASEFFCRQFRIPSEPRLTRYAVQLLGRSLTLDISAAESDWGFVPEISIDDGLKRYAQWRLATLER